MLWHGKESVHKLIHVVSDCKLCRCSHQLARHLMVMMIFMEKISEQNTLGLVTRVKQEFNEKLHMKHFCGLLSSSLWNTEHWSTKLMWHRLWIWSYFVYSSSDDDDKKNCSVNFTCISSLVFITVFWLIPKTKKWLWNMCTLVFCLCVCLFWRGRKISTINHTKCS